jgi:hypothetical protein
VPISPQKKQSIYVICIQLELSQPKSTGTANLSQLESAGTADLSQLEYAGTAFAVTETKVITCFHNVHDEMSETVYTDCVLVYSLSRKTPNSPVDFPTQRIPVTIVEYDEIDDWVVFERTDGEVFSSFLTVCPEQELPLESSVSELFSYYFPLGNFDAGEILISKVWSEKTQLFQYDGDEGNYVVVSYGKCKGSSGSPVVSKEGKVIAFHTSSFNEQQKKLHVPSSSSSQIPVVPRASKRPKLTLKALETKTSARIDMLENRVESRFEAIEEAVISSQDSHAEYSHATVICRTSKLMTALRLC